MKGFVGPNRKKIPTGTHFLNVASQDVSDLLPGVNPHGRTSVSSSSYNMAFNTGHIISCIVTTRPRSPVGDRLLFLCFFLIILIGLL